MTRSPTENLPSPKQVAHYQMKRLAWVPCNAIEIAGCRMADGMFMLPAIVSCKRQNAEHTPDPVVELAAAEKRSMTADMLDHEQANEKERSGHSK
jgi:hypothetical protein